MQIYKVLEELPIINITITANFDGSHIPIPLSNVHHQKNTQWTDLPTGKDMTIILSVTRENKFPKDFKAFAPKFSKVKFQFHLQL